MSDRAPGLDAPRNGGGCFNCGSQDHFAYVCPEPVRKEPHGAEAFRQRQAAKNSHGTGAKGHDNNRPKTGLVVTRYAPPLSQFPPPPPPPGAWGSAPNTNPYPSPNPSLPPNPYHQAPPPPPPSLPPGFPTSNQGPPAYPTPYPPPTAAGGYGPPPPPPPPGQSYGQYGQPHYPPAPPPSNYGPPTPYQPAPYSAPYPPPNPAYPGPPPPPSYSGSMPAPPPASYTPGYGSSMPPGPPPPSEAFPPTPYAPAYETPAPYTHPLPPPPPPPQGWRPDSSGQGHSRNRDHRDRRNDRDKGGRNKNNRRNNDNNQRGHGQRSDTTTPRSASNSRQHTPKPVKDTKIVQSKSPKAESATTTAQAAGKDEVNDADAEFAWELEKAFIECPSKAADPVGKPLAAEWNDDPTIPPAYNAKCIKTAFFDPESPDAFLASVRDTKYWTELQRDPVFRFRRGMVVVQFPGSQHEYFTYRCSRTLGSNWSKERDVVPVPSDTSLVDITKPRYINPSAMLLPRDADLPPKPVVNGKRNHWESDDPRRDRDVKRPRTTIGRERTPPGLPRRPSPHMDNKSPWSNSPRRPRSRDERSRSPGGYRPQTGDSLRHDRLAPPFHNGAAHRQDSGYHSSAHPTDKRRSRTEDDVHSHKRRLSPSPKARRRDRDRDTSRDRFHDRDRSPRERSRERGRRNNGGREERGSAWSPPPHRNSRSKSPRSHSRSQTATPAAADSDADSNLSDLEYELLGMSRPDKKKASPRKVIPKKRVKLNEAFSRRW